MRTPTGPQGHVLRQRLAKVWKVAPFRIDIEVVRDQPRVFLDGKPPTKEQLALIEKDLQALQGTAQIRGN